MELPIPYASIGVICAECNRSSIDKKGKILLLCGEHYMDMQQCAKNNKKHQFIFGIPKNMFLINSPRGKNIDDKAQICAILDTAHRLGIIGLTPQEITDIGRLDSKDYTYRRRCSDLKNDGKIFVIGWRFDGGRLNEVLALASHIPQKYFSNTFVDSTVNEFAENGYNRCGVCGALALGGKGTEKVIQIVNELRLRIADSKVQELLDILFPI